MTESKSAKPDISMEMREKLVEQYYKREVTAAQLSSEYGVHADLIYKWKYELDKKRKKQRAKELVNEGRSGADVRYIMQLEQELEEYKKKVGELTLANDFLKKFQTLDCPRTSAVSGLEKIRQELGQRKGRVK